MPNLILKFPFPGWISSKISLKNEINQIQENINNKWKKLVKKGDKKIDIHQIDLNQYEIDKFLEAYENYKRDKNFKGLDGKLLKLIINNEKLKPTLYSSTNINNNKYEKNLCLGYVLIIHYFGTAEYLIGINLHNYPSLLYYMLWNAIVMAKENGEEIFDLGGLTNSIESPINKFKSGLGGIKYMLDNVYIGYKF
jgi:lipid II:glycine glycyltransferase (peptidoglycan interpeptide bridge formation enzyme)